MMAKMFLTRCRSQDYCPNFCRELIFLTIDQTEPQLNTIAVEIARYHSHERETETITNSERDTRDGGRATDCNWTHDEPLYMNHAL